MCVSAKHNAQSILSIKSELSLLQTLCMLYYEYFVIIIEIVIKKKKKTECKNIKSQKKFRKFMLIYASKITSKV